MAINNTWKENTEYQIYLGCSDSQLDDEIVNEDELKKTVISFFSRKEIGFSIYSAKGGYIKENGEFVSENSLCINIIGDSSLDIVSLARNLSMFMNQECALVVKGVVKEIYN